MNLKLENNGKTRDIWNMRLFISIILLKATNLTFQITEILPDVVEYMIEGAIILLFAIILIHNLVVWHRKFNLVVLLLSIVLSFMYFDAYINYPMIFDDISKRFVWTVFLGLPCMWAVININNVGDFLKIIKPYSYCFTVLGTMIFLGDTVKLTSNMTFSGMMLFPFCLHYFYAFKNRFDCIVALYEFLIMFIHGSRGAVVSVLLMIVVYHFFRAINDFKYMKKFILTMSFLGGVLSVLLANISELIDWCFGNGIYIRNLNFIYAGGFTDDNGRYDIQAEYLELIFNSSPIRFVSVDLYNNGTNYPHNVFVEILYNYGYLLGGVLIIVLLMSLTRAMIKLKNEEYNFLMVLMCSGFFPLFTSFTYFEWPLFWGLIGYLLSQNIRRYKKAESSNEDIICG